MRLAYVCSDPGVPVFGSKGGSVHVQSVLRALVARGVEVTLFARRWGGDRPDGLGAVRRVKLDRPPSKDPETREPFLFAQNQPLRSALDAEGPFDAIYERHALLSFGAMEHARARGIPGLLEVNAPLIEEQRRYRSLLDQDLAEHARSRAIGAATAILPVSSPLASWLRTRIDDPGKVHVVPNGVDVERFGERTPAEGAPTVGFVGSLRPWHGAEQLLEVYLSLRSAGSPLRLRIVGDGPLTPWLERRSARAAGTVALVGAVEPGLVPAELSRIDIAVAPYPRLDSFYFSPLKLYEYMAAGCAIVASRCGQVGEVIEHGVTGLLYEPDDIEGMRAAIARLAEDTGLRERLGSAARARAVERHGWDRVADRVLQLAAAAPGVPA